MVLVDSPVPNNLIICKLEFGARRAYFNETYHLQFFNRIFTHRLVELQGW